MGHNGPSTEQLDALVLSCLDKLATAAAPRHAFMQFPCIVKGGNITIAQMEIKSASLAACLKGCTQVYLLAATLGADVDRLIARRVKIDSAEALCLQACAAHQLEDYCNVIEHDIAHNVCQGALSLRPRFSPGYGDFDIAWQTGILRLLNAQKLCGISETKTHMLAPLKSVTAVIGAGLAAENSIPDNACKYKCGNCGKIHCQFRNKEKLIS